MTDWIPYPGQGKGGRSLPGRFVTITVKGAIAISKELAAGLNKDLHNAAIEFDREGRRLRITQTREQREDTVRIIWPTKKGVQPRIGAQFGMKEWGLCPVVSTRYMAEFLPGNTVIIVDLNKPVGSEAGRGHETPVLEEQEPAQEKKVTLALIPSCATCASGTRLKGQQAILCDCDRKENPHRTHLRPPTALCNDWKERLEIPPDRSVQAGVADDRGRIRSSERRTCPTCHTEHAVTTKGLWPHDIHGIDYRAGRGDRENPCPGSRT